VLLVPAKTPSLELDTQALGLAWEDLGGGYWRLRGLPFVLYVAEIDEVAEAEDDDLLRLFGHAEPHTVEARRWLYEQVGAKEMRMGMHELEGYEDLIQKFIAAVGPEVVLRRFKPEERLAGLPPEERLAGLAPEERLVDLDRDHAVLALPDEMLHALSDEYISTLSEDARAKVRARIGR